MGRPAEEDGFSGATLAQEEDNTLVRRGLDLKGGGGEHLLFLVIRDAHVATYPEYRWKLENP